MKRPEISPKRYQTFALVALLLVGTIIVTGAAVRLSGSGLGCDDWPNCTSKELISFTSKNQTIELVNRMFTGLVSLGVMAAVLGSLLRKPRRRDLVRLSWALVAGVFLQAIIGGIAVLVELQWQSVALHFLASMVLLAAALVLVRRSREAEGPYVRLVSTSTQRIAHLILILTSWVLLAGTFVTGAGPHGGDEKATRLDVQIPTVARIHGISVMVLIALVLVLFVRLRAERAPAESLRAVEVLLAVGAIQAGIGYFQYFNGIPAFVVGVHVLGATLVFSAAQWLQFTLRAPVGAPVEGSR